MGRRRRKLGRRLLVGTEHRLLWTGHVPIDKHYLYYTPIMLQMQLGSIVRRFLIAKADYALWIS